MLSVLRPAFLQRPPAHGTGKHGVLVSGKGRAASPARPTQTQINTLQRTAHGSPARRHRHTGSTERGQTRLWFSGVRTCSPSSFYFLFPPGRGCTSRAPGRAGGFIPGHSGHAELSFLSRDGFKSDPVTTDSTARARGPGAQLGKEALC